MDCTCCNTGNWDDEKDKEDGKPAATVEGEAELDDNAQEAARAKKQGDRPTRIDTIFLSPLAVQLYRGFHVRKIEGINRHRQLVLRLAMGGDDDTL